MQFEIQQVVSLVVAMYYIKNNIVEIFHNNFIMDKWETIDKNNVEVVIAFWLRAWFGSEPPVSQLCDIKQII